MNFSIPDNTLWCWPEKELHRTTALPSNGVASTFSQNLAKRTIIVIQKWRQEKEKESHKQYWSDQLNQNPIAQNTLLKSIKLNKIQENEIILELENSDYCGNILI